MPRDSRVPLSRDRIFEAALAVADHAGASAVTMRGVAQELGVQAMSLYHHVRDREDLLDGLAELMVRRGLPVPPAAMPVRGLLAGFARGIRDTAHAHPEAFSLVGLRPLRSAEAARAITALLSSLGRAGMSPRLAVTSYRVVAAYARGFALSEIAGQTFGPGMDSPVPDSLAPYAEALGSNTGAMFESGLEAVIDGLERAIPAGRPAGRGRPSA